MKLPKLSRWFALTPRNRTSVNCRSLRPRLEALEDRTVPSTVMNLNDSGAGSLRQAILDTSAGSTIDFAPKLHGTITLTSGELLITRSVTINGPGANK